MERWGSSGRSTPSGWEERCGDARDALSQEVDENREWVKLALATGAEQRGQDLLRVRPEPRAIAARDFPIDDNDRFILPVSVILAKFTTPGIRMSGSASPSSTRTTGAVNWWRSARCQTAPERLFRCGCST